MNMGQTPTGNHLPLEAASLPRVTRTDTEVTRPVAALVQSDWLTPRVEIYDYMA
jgi:hypothetical protein